VAERPGLRHVVLMCPAVNDIDASALESLQEINHRLADAGIRFHLSEVKGPVMDRLQRSDFLDHLTGRVFLSQHAADCALRAAAGPFGSVTGSSARRGAPPRCVRAAAATGAARPSNRAPAGTRPAAPPIFPPAPAGTGSAADGGCPMT